MIQYFKSAFHKHGTAWIRTIEAGLLLLALPVLLFPDRWPKVTAAFLVALVLVWLLQSLLARDPWPITPLNGALLLFAATVSIGVVVTPLPDLTLPKATGLVLGLAVFRFLAVWVSSRARLVMALAGFGLVGAGILGVGALGANWGAKVPALQAILDRLPSLAAQLPDAPEAGISPNQLAGALTLYLPLAVLGVLSWRVPARRLWWWLLLLTALLVLLGVLILTQSRAGWVGSIAGLVVLLALAGFTSPQRHASLGASLVLAAVLAAGIAGVWVAGGIEAAGEALYNRDTRSVVEETVGEMDLEARVEIWNRALYAIADFPFTGCGLGTFREVVWLLYPLFIIPQGYDIAHAHNIFLQTALDLGLPGLIGYVALLLVALSICWQVARNGDFLTRRVALGLAAGLAGLHIYGLADAVALGSKPGLAFWMALAIIAVLPRMQTLQETPTP